nr:hypothetical protein [Gimesia algae]
MRAAHAMASSRDGSSSTVKPPLSGGAHEYPPAANVPSAETSTGGTASSITACASRPTASSSPSGTTIAAPGNGRQSYAMFFAERHTRWKFANASV